MVQRGPGCEPGGGGAPVRGSGAPDEAPPPRSPGRVLPPPTGVNVERPTVVLAALPEEVRPLRERLADRTPSGSTARPPTGSRPWIVRGRLAGRAVAIVVTGDGERNAGEGARRAIDALSPAAVIAIGVAGGLAPDLAPGSLVAAHGVVGRDGSVLCAEHELVDRLIGAGARRGVVWTTDRILDSPEAKAELRASAASASAASGPDAASEADGGCEALLPDVVDLESALYAKEARRADLPWAVLRCVIDAAGEDLPGWLERCRDRDGAIRRGAVLAHACLRPWTAPTLFRLRSRLRRGAERLADAVEIALSASVAGTTGRAGSEKVAVEVPEPARSGRL